LFDFEFVHFFFFQLKLVDKFLFPNFMVSNLNY
jgi:hypothetical protein